MQEGNVYALVAVFAFIGVYLARRLARSPYGLILRAIKSNETRLASTGVDVWRYKMVARSEEHTSELQSLMRNSYAVFCLKKKNTHLQTAQHTHKCHEYTQYDNAQ